MSFVDNENTTTPAGSPAPAEVEEDQSTDTAPPETEETETAPESDEPQPGDEDFEEIDHAGQKYRVPKELKDAFLRQADYTTKTQAVAEQRRALETEQAAITAQKQAVAEQAKAHQERIREYGHLAALDAAIGQYARVNWDAWFDQDPIEAQKGANRRNLLMEQRNGFAHKIINDEQESARKAAAERETASAKRREEARSIVKDIKGYDSKTDQELRAYAVTQGFTDADLGLFLEHPRLIKVLHKAWRGDELLKKQTTTRSSAPPSTPSTPSIPAEPIKPLTTVSRARSRPPSAEPADRDSDEEWLRKRNAQLRKPK